MDFSQKVRFSDTLFAQEIDGETVLLDMTTENYFGLDAVATDIWNLLQEGRSIGETYDALLESYDVDPEVLESDLRTFIDGLLQHKLATLQA